MHEPMSAPMVGAGPRSTLIDSAHLHHQASASRSPGYNSAASSPSSSSSIASPVSSTSNGTSSGVSLSASSTFSPQHPSSSQSAGGQQQAGASATGSQLELAATLHTIKQEQQHGKPPVSALQRPHHGKQSINGAANMSSSLFEFFPELNYDGAMITWFHGANNRASLTTAMMSDKMFVAGDISLAEMSRYPVPIMARPPLGVSDLTLESWLSDMTQTQKGIKLTFTSTRTVEPAFRVLARHAEQLRGPLILSADILTRPCPSASASSQPNGRPKPLAQHQSQQQQPVDAWTFLMLCRTRFPKSIISIGWCSSAQPQQQLPSVASVDSNSSTNSLNSVPSDSMFELDIDGHHIHHPMGAYLVDDGRGAATGAQQQEALMQQLAAAAQAHHLLPPTALGASAATAQNQQAPGMVASAAAALHRLSPGSISIHHYHNHFHHQNQRNHHHKHHLSSGGSLSSNSSGNSSGSPSPTSPLSSHLAHQHNHHSSYHHNESPEHQLILAAAAASQQGAEQKPPQEQPVDWPAAVAAAAMVAASSFQQHHQQDSQLPLNLNINEADPKHTSSLGDFARRIQSIRQRNAQPTILTSNSTTININKVQQKIGQQQQHLTLASKLTSGKQMSNSNSWQHISKKAAITTCLNSNSPSPISASPKQQQYKVSNLLCVSKPQQQIAGMKQHQQTTCNNDAGYTREMIDKMASLVKEYNLTQQITFPVEARLLLRNNNSLNELQRLLYQVGSNSTLTIVAQPEDLIGVDDLLQMRKHFSPQQILFDLPDDLAIALRQEIDLI